METTVLALLIGINRYPNLNARMQLDGCLNDVQAMAHVLEARFGFPAARITVLQDEEATQAGIRAAMDDLLRRAHKDDVVVMHYSGHGSKMRDREGTEPDGWDETIVPYDSGRRPHPNRDISDDEIYAWLLKLSAITPYVTLIFDSCFSGSIARDAFAAKVRRLEPDPRPVEDLPPSPVGVRGARREVGASGWLPLSRRYVLFAGCRDHESSHELKAQTPHGALSFFLCRELTRTAAATTWRDLYERVSREVTAVFPSQHPQLEGARDRELFGVRSLAPMRFIPVRERAADRVVLGAGVAHGLSAGSRWAIYPQGTRRLSAATPWQGLVRVSATFAVTAEAEILEEAEEGSIESGSRAVEHALYEEEKRLAVEVRGEAGAPERVAELKEGIAGSGLLRPAAAETSELRVYAVAPRKRAQAEDPVPRLGALSVPVWVAVGHDGELVMPIHPIAGAGAVDQLLAHLEHLARYRRILALENRDPESPLYGRIEVVLKRQRPGESWAVAEPREGTGEIVFEEGDRVALEITNHHRAPIYLGVLDFGLTWRIGLVYPVEGANEALVPDRTLEIGVREGEELELTIPEGFPFGKPAGSEAAAGGIESVKIIATTHETDFSALAQEPLLAIPRRTNEDWTTVTRSFTLRRRRRLKTTMALW